MGKPKLFLTASKLAGASTVGSPLPHVASAASAAFAPLLELHRRQVYNNIGIDR